MITVTSFANKSVGVLGLGSSGLSAVRALEAGGSDVWAWDDLEEKRENAKSLGFRLTNLYQSDFSKIDTLILSPGIPDQYPEPHTLTVRAREAGCAIICDIDLSDTITFSIGSLFFLQLKIALIPKVPKVAFSIKPLLFILLFFRILKTKP